MYMKLNSVHKVFVSLNNFYINLDFSTCSN